MAITRWTPLTSDFDDIVQRAFGDFGSRLLSARDTGWAPALDAFVEGDEMHVRLELPGIDPDADVDIEVTGGVLHVTGERSNSSEKAADGEGWYRREMSYGRFERHVALPEGTDPDSLSATYDAGILDIRIPLPSKAKTKVKVDVANTKQLKS